MPTRTKVIKIILWASASRRNLTQQEGFLGHGYQEAQHPVQMQRLPSGPKTWLLEEKVTGLKMYHYMNCKQKPRTDEILQVGGSGSITVTPKPTIKPEPVYSDWFDHCFCAIISPTSFVMKVLCDNFFAPRSRWRARMVTSIVTTGPKMTNARRILNGIYQMSHCPHIGQEGPVR